MKERTILAIDDDPGTRMLAQAAFAGEDYEVVLADSGKAGLAMLQRVKPDVILLDIMMPEMDGYQTCSAIKQTRGFEHTPVIMLTGLDDIDAVEKAYDCGAWDFTSKPINWPIIRHRVRYALRAAEAFANQQKAARLSRTIDNSHSEVITFNYESRTIVGANASALRNLGYDLEQLQAMAFTDIAIETEEQPIVQNLEDLVEKQQANLSFQLRRSDDSTYPAEGIFLYSDDEDPHVCIGVFQDMSERRRVEAELHRLAYYDELTNLPNRRLLQEQVEQSLKVAKRKGSRTAICMLDLDGFKRVNDTLGHSVGDMLLKEVSERLVSVVRQRDQVARGGSEDEPQSGARLARLGGDEFLILLSDYTDGDAPAKVAARVLKQLSMPYYVHKTELNLTASIGIASYPDDGDSLDALMMRADAAMYKAKHSGKNNYAFSADDAGENSIARLTLEADLRNAISNNELELHYQPQLDDGLQHIIGAECLLRWRHPEHGLRPPDSFIPVAEETGLILPIGEWVLQEAVAQLNRWDRTLQENLKMSVNVSGIQMRQPGFLESTQLLMQGFPASRGQLVIELTESALMSNAAGHVEWLQKLKQAGAEIAIDDFGTGYSSLSYLKKFPIDYLKVDRSFVQDLEHDREDAAITRAIFRMAQELGLEIVVEGVETQSQLEIVRAMGDCQVQGWLISKALPALEFEAFVRKFNQDQAGRSPARQGKVSLL
ncbi:MAG: EAL domain-containing protein [Halieaceae bacterium]